MTKFQLARIAAATAVAALSCSFASAADNYSMSVTASVTGTCVLGTTPNLDFGPLNQVSGGLLTPSAIVTQSATAPIITVGGSLSGSYTGGMTNGTDTITYTLGWTTPAATPLGFGAATPVNLTLLANLPAANYQNVSAGSYLDTVLISIAP